MVGRLVPQCVQQCMRCTAALHVAIMSASANGHKMQALKCAAAAAAGHTAEQEEAVWVFECWRRHRLAQRQQAMVAEEAQRMASLESLAICRESSRQRDVSDATTRVKALQSQVLSKAEVLETRETRLQAAEEAALRRWEELAVEDAARVAEGCAAVARLQTECAHQLEGERRRLSEAAERRVDAEAELEAAEVRYCCYLLQRARA
jgi:hypothetical protein